MCSVVEGFISSSLRCVLVCMWKVTSRKYSEVSGSRDVCVNDRPNKPTRRPRLTYHTSRRSLVVEPRRRSEVRSVLIWKQTHLFAKRGLLTSHHKIKRFQWDNKLWLGCQWLLRHFVVTYEGGFYNSGKFPCDWSNQRFLYFSPIFLTLLSLSLSVHRLNCLRFPP